MSDVWADAAITNQSELLVLLAIADYANDEGEAWPSIESIATKSRHTDRGVQKILNRLQKCGKIEIRTGGGMGNTSRYRVLAKGEPRSPLYGPKGEPGGMQRVNLETPKGERAVHPIRHRTINEIHHKKSDAPAELVLEGEETREKTAFKNTVDRWCAGFKAALGVDYTFAGAKDAKAVKFLLGSGWTSDRIIELASEAWKKTDPKTHWACVNQTRSLATFASAINKISSEVYAPSKPVEMPAWKQAQLLVEAIEKHVANSESVYYQSHCTPEQKQDLRAKRQRLRELQAV